MNPSDKIKAVETGTPKALLNRSRPNQSELGIKPRKISHKKKWNTASVAHT
jgi:hypothetical protein